MLLLKSLLLLQPLSKIRLKPLLQALLLSLLLLHPLPKPRLKPLLELLHALLPASLEPQQLFHTLQLPQQQQLLHPLLPAHPLLHPWLELLL